YRRSPFPARAENHGRHARPGGDGMMSIEFITPAAAKPPVVAKSLVSRDCGPEGCEVDWLASRRIETEDDVADFTDFAIRQGWGDGLPLVPPSESRIRHFLAENDRYPDEVIAHLP